VTVWEYGKYPDRTGAEKQSGWVRQKLHPGHMVVNVTWRRAQEYCGWAMCTGSLFLLAAVGRSLKASQMDDAIGACDEHLRSRQWL
jgi:hypothetical protein